MRQAQEKDFSPFYSREYHKKNTESEERLIFRWFQMLEQRFLIFNVSNKHDCLRANREEKERARSARCQPRPIVVQPFHSVPNFYGCVMCGKYHICSLKRESCSLVTDPADGRRSCGYSGKLLPIQDDLEVANFEEDRRTENEARYASLPSYMTSGARRGSPKKYATKLHASKKRPYKSKVMDLFKEKDDLQQQPNASTGSNKRSRSSSSFKLLVKDVAYDFSVDSLSFSEDNNIEDERDAGEEATEEEGDKINAIEMAIDTMDDEDNSLMEVVRQKEEDASNGMERLYNEDASSTSDEEDKRKKKKRRHEVIFDEGIELENDDEKAKVEAKKENEQANLALDTEKEWHITEHYESGGEDDTGGETFITAYDNENGDGSHAKNYHNNIRYKNDYYAFLRSVLKKHQRKEEDEEEEEMNMNHHERFIDLYKRDMREEEPLLHQRRDTTTKAEDEVGDDEKYEEEAEKGVFFSADKKLGPSVCEKIDEEVGRIIKTLLKIDLPKKPYCKLKPYFIHKTLSHYFTKLVKNLTLLIYQSPTLTSIAQKRSTKNQNQTTKFSCSTLDPKSVAQPQDDVDYHEFTLCPTKIARSLLLCLFVEPFSITVNGYRIQIWGRDHWLRSLYTNSQDQQRLFRLFHRLHYNDENRKEFQRFEKELRETSALILDCLAHYNVCPLWLRDMVFIDL